MSWVFKIFPSIGVARIGNCPDDSPSGFYVGPEIPGSVIVPTNGYKDAQGRVRHQAARFRIYGWENGVFMGEITSSVANITWTVELANTKAASMRSPVSGIQVHSATHRLQIAARWRLHPGRARSPVPTEKPSLTPGSSWECRCHWEKSRPTRAAGYWYSEDSVLPVRPRTRRS